MRKRRHGKALQVTSRRHTSDDERAAPGSTFSVSQRLLALEASSGIPHGFIVVLAAPFALLEALRWLLRRRR